MSHSIDLSGTFLVLCIWTGLVCSAPSPVLVQNQQLGNYYPLPLQPVYPGYSFHYQQPYFYSSGGLPFPYQTEPKQILTNAISENSIPAGFNPANIDPRLTPTDIILAIPFLPIEINVPDTVSAIFGGVQGFISSIGQRIPFFNRWITGVSPRPSDLAAMMNSPGVRFAYNGNFGTHPQVPMVFLIPVNSRQSRSKEDEEKAAT